MATEQSSAGVWFAHAFVRALAVVAVFAVANAHASFHTWSIAEIYSDAAGIVQFVELREASGANFQDQFAGRTLTVQQGATTRVYTFPTNLAGTTTANKRLLIATAAFASLGLVTPDFIVPTPFLFPGGGSLDFAGIDLFVYPALPTDGVSSLDRSGASTVNSPTNFAGQSGSIAAPLPPPPPAAGIPALNWVGTILLAAGLLIAGVVLTSRQRRPNDVGSSREG